MRVSEEFRVIALGLPVPKYAGNPLDPPLRSRFQARDVSPPTYQVFFLSIFPWVHLSKDSILSERECGRNQAFCLGSPAKEVAMCKVAWEIFKI